MSPVRGDNISSPGPHADQGLSLTDGRHEHARLRAGPRQNSLLLGRTMAISIFELLFPTIYMDNAIIIALLDTETTYFLRRPFPD